MIEKIKRINDAFHTYHCRHRSIIDVRFREKGLYFGQPPILKYLSEHKNATQKEIAEFLHVSAPSVATSLKRMEEAGMVVRVEHKKDARRNSIMLTKKGKELVKYADNLFLRVDDVAYKGFSPDEMDTLVEFLERMNNNLKTYEEEDGNA